MSDFNGEIMIKGTKKILKYNIDDQEYWVEESKEYFKKLAKDINKENSNSTLLDSDDGENTPSIDRFSEKNIAHVHGYE